MRKEPKTITGMRSTSTATPATEDGLEIPAEIRDALNANRVKKAQAPVVIYSSRFKNFMTTMQMDDDIVIGNRVTRGKNKHIRFENFQFKTANPEIIEWLESQEFYGLGRSVWRTADENALHLAIAGRKLASEVRAYQGDLDALRVNMSAEDFDALEKLSGAIEAQKAAVSQ